jgi:hypothetical protein
MYCGYRLSTDNVPVYERNAADCHSGVVLVPVDVIATREETYKEYQAETEPCLPGWEVFIYNVYIIIQFKPFLLGGGGGGG